MRSDYYILDGEEKHETTWFKKEELKKLGCKWNASLKIWEIQNINREHPLFKKIESMGLKLQWARDKK